MPAKGRILFVSADRSFIHEISTAHRAAEFEFLTVPDAANAVPVLSEPLTGSGPCGLVIDMAGITLQESLPLLEAHKARTAWQVFLIKAAQNLSPVESAPLRVIHWPMPPGFVEQTVAVDRPVVFLTESSLFKAKALPLCFNPTPIQPVVLQSTDGLAEFLMQNRKPTGAVKSKGLFSRLGDLNFWENTAPIFAKTPTTPGAGLPDLGSSLLGHVVVVHFPGSQSEAEDFDTRLRERVPEAACYYVTNADPLLDAAKAARVRAPINLLRHHAIHIPSILESWESKNFLQQKTPVLLMDNDLDMLTSLAQSLLSVGYQVDMAKDPKEAMKLFSARGKYHAVVVGLTFSYSFTYAQGAGPELAKNMSRLDPDVRFIFMVDLYPLERALREMSKAIELGADDALIKPVEPSRLLSALERSLQRRRIYSASAKLEREGAVPQMISDPDSLTLIAGRYDLVFQIGEGGMGLVYLASDRQLGRKVALKRMRPEIKANPAHRERFIQEARLISRLNHPYIVGVHEIVEHKGEIYLVLDYVDGKPLSNMLGDGKRIDYPQARAIFFQVCQAIDAAHRGHILHRDLKPSNIMIDINGYAKVMDFGLAREMKETVTLLTQKDVGGTLAYMAPEQHLGRCGATSDIYALGVCLYECLTGEIPFKGPDYLPQKERRLYAPASSLVAGLPQAVDGLIDAVLDPDPKTRIQTALGLFEALSKLETA